MKYKKLQMIIAATLLCTSAIGLVLFMPTDDFVVQKDIDAQELQNEAHAAWWDEDYTKMKVVDIANPVNGLPMFINVTYDDDMHAGSGSPPP